MKKLKVLELFSGVGSFSVALNTLNIPHEIVGYADIRESSVKLFCKIHGANPEDNLGDVKNVDGKQFTDVDLLVYGSPCQSFTRAGRSDGGEKGSNTKSSLMWEAVRIINEAKPKIVVWENVPDAISKKHLPNFLEYVSELKDIGYNTYYKIINAHEIGAAQKRRRLFAISIRTDIDNGNFKFIEKHCDPTPLSEYLREDYIDYANEKVHDSLYLEKTSEGVKIFNGTKLGYLIANEGDAIDLGYHTSKLRRGRVQKQACQTLMRSKSIGTLYKDKLRYLTPLEYWLLQEMPEDMFKLVEECEFGKTQIYDVVGGVINQKHLEVVFNSLKECFNWETE